jgi:uncharacterized lipoprotein NlpE involved in copper resistance
MKKAVIILSAIVLFCLVFLGCKTQEDTFFKEHSVIFYATDVFDEFETKAKIKVDEAYQLQINFSKKNNVQSMAYMFFVIDDYYVFTSYFHPKIPEASIRGIWIHSQTGETKYVEKGIFLKGSYMHYPQIKTQ